MASPCAWKSSESIEASSGCHVCVRRIFVLNLRAPRGGEQGEMAHPIRIGVDFGGTKLEVIALSADGRELYRKRAPTPSGDYDGQIAAVVRMVAELEQAVGAAGTVGVGIPGAISPATGLIKNANSTWLIGRPLDRDLARALNRPVRLQNDAKCLAVSEVTDGAAAGAEMVFAAILGTGVGAGIVVHGRPLAGRNAIAGEWGHNQLPRMRDDERPGPTCYCRLHGCIETILSGPGLARDHRETTGLGLTAQQLASLAAQGHVDAEQTLRRYEDRLARGLAHV